MFQAKAMVGGDKVAVYQELAQQLGGLLSGERDAIANAAPASACRSTCVPRTFQTYRQLTMPIPCNAATAHCSSTTYSTLPPGRTLVGCRA